MPLGLADVAPADSPSISQQPDWSPGLAAPICRSKLTEAERLLLDDHAYRYGTAPESYDILISEGSLLRTPCQQGIISVLPHLNYWHCPGGILAPDELKPGIIDWLSKVARARRLTIALYSIGPDEVDLFHKAGWEINKVGEEPVLDLKQLTWQGKDFEWVRRQSNFCKRAGIEILEIRDDAEKHRLADELVSILHEDLAGRTFPKPLRLLEGEFDPYALYRRRLFLARSSESGRIEGFLACSPMLNGSIWAFETYRKRKDAPRGVIPYLFREVADRLKQEGVDQVSLCLVPGKGISPKTSPGGYWLATWSLSLWYKRMNFLFNSQGQNYFKSRFRPRFIDRYICVTPHSSLLSISSFLYTTGAYSPNLVNTFRNLWNSWKNPFPKDE